LKHHKTLARYIQSKRNGKSRRGKDGNNKKDNEDKKYLDVKDVKEGTGKKQVNCFKCEGDHYISQYPELKKSNESDEERIVAYTLEASMSTT
jgi:hypothetical protein